MEVMAFHNLHYAMTYAVGIVSILSATSSLLSMIGDIVVWRSILSDK